MTAVIFEAEPITESLSIVYQVAQLGPKIREITTEVLTDASKGLVTLEDLGKFFEFLQWFTNSLSRAYDGNVKYLEAISKADNLLDQLRNKNSSSEVSHAYAELAACFISVFK